MAACGEAALEGEGDDARTLDVGIANMAAGSAAGAEVAGSAGGAAGDAAGSAGSLGAAGSAGSAGSLGVAGSSGSAGSLGVAGMAGGAAGGAAGAAGSLGAAGAAGSAGAAGAAGAAGSGSGGGSYTCPLGTTDADGNGYPDACETVLSTINLEASPISYSTGYTMSAYFVLMRALSPADTAKYPDCDPSINAVGQGYPVQPGAPETRIFDVRTDANLSHFIACETTFLAQPNGVSKLSKLAARLLFNVHSTWPQDRTGPGSGNYRDGGTQATLTPTFTIVYARREVTYASGAFSGRWTLHGYLTPQ